MLRLSQGFLLYILIIFPFFNGFAQLKTDSLSISLATNWADSVMTQMELDEKIAQCIFVRTYSNKKEEFYYGIDALVEKTGVGGLVFFQGNPYQQGILTNRWQEKTHIPLFVSMDAETGLGWRLKGSYTYPRQMTLGALRDNSYITRMGRQIAKKLQSLGVHINYAPVADVNNNPDNPVINTRSFGENPVKVAEKCLAFIEGLREYNIMPVAKHFPGHGDTDTDSHYSLPVIKHQRERLDSIELYPFKVLINDSLEAIMTAHIFTEALQQNDQLPGSMSQEIITDLLIDELGFKGLIITDGLDMAGASAGLKPGEAGLMAMKAGNDVLLIPENVPATIRSIRKAVQKNEIAEAEVDLHCKKVLISKYLHGLNKNQKIDLHQIKPNLKTAEDRLLSRQIFENAITLLKNNNNILPLNQDDLDIKIAVLNMDEKRRNYFNTALTKDLNADIFSFKPDDGPQQALLLQKTLQEYDYIIINFLNTDSRSSENFGIHPNCLNLLNRLQLQNKIILNLFTSPYALKYFENEHNIEAISIAYQYLSEAQKAMAAFISGKIPAKGQLPVQGNKHYPCGSGINTKLPQKLVSGPASNELILAKDLQEIDTIIQHGLDSLAYPGGQILIARNGHIIFEKNFGYTTSEKSTKVQSASVYDLASLTKILASTLAVMKLYEDSLMDVKKTLSYYLPELDTTNKAHMTIEEIMSHQARLEPWIPFYLNTLSEDFVLDTSLYRSTKMSGFEICVADRCFLLNSYRDSIFHDIYTSELLDKKEYKYSDLGFYLLKVAVERITNQAFDKYLDSSFYQPMELNTMGFNPLERLPRSMIVPTENDTLFRHQLLQGYVHDYGAAMLGGISGHAGLFGNAYDVAAVMQMLLNGGIYNGKRYLNPETITFFTQSRFPEDDNRRGLGFDKPPLENDGLGPVCISAPASSYGHSGFTGTYAWADPDHQLIYIFLCNRIHPFSSNRVLIENNIRTRIQQVMYDAIEKGQKHF